MANHIYLMIKIFDNEEHADAFLNKGEMYCRTLGEFKKIEGDEHRGDQYEGVTDWHQPDQIKLTISFRNENGVEKTIPIEKLAGPLIMQNTAYDRLNLFCMYAIKVEEFKEVYSTEEERKVVIERLNKSFAEQTKVNEKSFELGDFAVMVYKVEDFIEKIRKHIFDNGHEFSKGLVKYYDPETFHGSFKGIESVFRKRNIYSYQSEYRFAFYLKNTDIGTQTISVGSLKDCAIKIPTKELNGLKIELSDSTDKPE